jgi:regulator of sigma E protease
MLSLLLMLIALGVMITIHELGHFLVARAFGVGIEKFSIGFGAPIAQFERGGVQYRIAWIPLGGYVKMKGQEPDDTDDETDESEMFNRKPWWQRVLIVFAGPFANLLLGLLLFIVAFTFPQKMEDLSPVISSAEGIWAEHFQPGDSLLTVNDKAVGGFNRFLIEVATSPANARVEYIRGGETLEFTVPFADRDSLMRSLIPRVTTLIGEVFSGMPAWRAGLKPLDRIVMVDSVEVSDWYDMRSRIINAPGTEVELVIARGNEQFSRSISLEENIASDQGRMIGISQYLPISETIRYSPPEAVVYGSMATTSFIVMNYKALFNLVKRPSQLKSSMGGPVMMASMSTEMGKRGFGSLLLFFASISLILMVMNLLPIPILDGGHILFAFIEGIIGRPVPVKVQEILQRVGFAILITLMIYAFYSDITKLIMRFIHTR